MHVGIVFGFVVEKNTDHPVGDPRRTFKGRVVFQGSNVKNQKWENAVFADLGSSPSSMEAGRLVGAFGLRPNYENPALRRCTSVFAGQNQGETHVGSAPSRPMARILATYKEAGVQAECCSLRSP